MSTNQVAKEDGKQSDNKQTKEDRIKIDISYLLENLVGPKDSKIDVNHLWGKCYRVNFWGKKGTNTESFIEERIIVESFFIVVDHGMNGTSHSIK